MSKKKTKKEQIDELIINSKPDLTEFEEKEDIESKIIAKYLNQVKDRAKYFGTGLIMGNIVGPLTVFFVLIVFILFTNNQKYIENKFSNWQESIFNFLLEKRK
jgi:hypothetical protein